MLKGFKKKQRESNVKIICNLIEIIFEFSSSSASEDDNVLGDRCQSSDDEQSRSVT